jgi:hypothetical protein
MFLQNYYPLLLEKKILLSELKIHPRIYSAWKDEDIAIFDNEQKLDLKNTEKRKWVYLNVFEALWLLIVVELRKLNLDLKTIKKLKDFLNEMPDYKLYFEGLNEVDFQEKVVKQLSQEMLDSIGGSISMKQLIGKLSSISAMEKSPFLTNLGLLIHGVFINKSLPSINMKLDKETRDFDFSISFNGSSNSKFKEELFEFYTASFSYSTMINIPIISIIEQLFENENLITYCSDYGFFSNQERQLFEAIRNDECEEIKIVKHQSGDCTINFSNSKSITGDEAKKLRRILGLKNYDRVEVIYRNENHLLIKNTKKKVLNKIMS